jgi:hypothetical protein
VYRKTVALVGDIEMWDGGIGRRALWFPNGHAHHLNVHKCCVVCLLCCTIIFVDVRGIALYWYMRL